MLDENGYPTEGTLTRIEIWPSNDPNGLIEFLKKAWHWTDYITVEQGDTETKLTLVTGGWSGNEDIVYSLRQNMFWNLYWESSKRGGSHVFIIPNDNL